ncbi:nucleotidyl transferase AbiEii/AbiGii toxin family protein [Streptomyces sp. NPDC005774]|uniref:nucleotidyl transferase AbiEii/AbiGii toxin family protein n=1 Tax=Streptomyces sp. NPDC005774 TaxID=3364728 RepID=UPI0036CEC5FB
MGKTYATPTAFRTALKQAATNMSKKTGMSVAELMKIFYFNRLAARVFTKEPDGWLIKGGQALLVRYRGAARLSQDIDLQCAQPDRTAEDARQLIIDAASLDLGDYLRYAPSKFEEHSVDFLPLVNEGDSYGSRRGGFCFIADCPPGELR